jgi:hypothetical protein
MQLLDISQTDERKSGKSCQSCQTKVGKKGSGKQGALLCKPSRDEDSRKLILSVMLDQGLAKKAQKTKGIVMQTKGIVMQTKS